MPLLLGLDTGGTYTDAVLMQAGGAVIAAAKALTTKHELAIGIRGALQGVLPEVRGPIGFVSLSTTLATNAIVEGHRSPICLLLLGYEQSALDRAGLRPALGSDPVVFIRGGHTPFGEEQAPLDVEAVREAAAKHASRVAAFAISGYFSVRNPGHELAAQRVVQELTALPVTCGHRLTSKLDAPRRALTAALNARLIPQIAQLIRAVQAMLAEQRIEAPLMVVKGDGSLVGAAVALESPVETILSGPAASLVGARFLSGAEDGFVADMGGTTTDIALLRQGRPVLAAMGATVGGWRTMVEAIAVHTFGLGGDSQVEVDGGLLAVGPRRHVPLSLLAAQHPAALEVLRLQARDESPSAQTGRFALRQRALDGGGASLGPGQAALWDRLAEGPAPLASLYRQPGARRAILALLERGLIVVSGFTPTDAAHLLGLQDGWSREAAELGAEIWRRRLAQQGGPAHPSAEAFAAAVLAAVVREAGRAVLDTALRESGEISLDEAGALAQRWIEAQLTPAESGPPLVNAAIGLALPLVAIGAPARIYFPEVAARLRTAAVIPEHAAVCNAVGAVAGGIVQTASVLITAPGQGRYRVHLATGPRDFDTVEEATAIAAAEARAAAAMLAERAGAADIACTERQEDRIVREPGGLEIFLERRVVATAFGRPRLAADADLAGRHGR